VVHAKAKATIIHANVLKTLQAKIVKTLKIYLVHHTIRAKTTANAIP
jgi:hypothetical protein